VLHDRAGELALAEGGFEEIVLFLHEWYILKYYWVVYIGY
jgi:hypothetical protein